MQRSLIIRTDGDSRIGAGHVMRCCSIARQALKSGMRIFFAVSHESSRSFVEQQGFKANVIGGDVNRFCGKDGNALSEFAHTHSASSILIDSYAVNFDFFSELKNGLSGKGVKVSYIDDVFTYEKGIMQVPAKWPVDMVINYTFGFYDSDYDAVYSPDTECLIGPQFAPIRDTFSFKEIREIEPTTRRVLVMSGSTNPNGTLERLVDILRDALPYVYLDVVVGGLATYEGTIGNNIKLLNNVQDMAALMKTCDMAISAAGSTLYELCATGTPTIAYPLVDNQLRNVQGFLDAKAGTGIDSLDWDDSQMTELIRGFSSDEFWRASCATHAKKLVDGLGAERIAVHL